MNQATPKLSEDKVKQCVDNRLQDQYPPKAVAKVINTTHILIRAKRIKSLLYLFVACYSLMAIYIYIYLDTPSLYIYIY